MASVLCGRMTDVCGKIDRGKGWSLPLWPLGGDTLAWRRCRTATLSVVKSGTSPREETSVVTGRHSFVCQAISNKLITGAQSQSRHGRSIQWEKGASGGVDGEPYGCIYTVSWRLSSGIVMALVAVIIWLSIGCYFRRYFFTNKSSLWLHDISISARYRSPVFGWQWWSLESYY